MSSRRIVPGFAALICAAALLLSACTGSDGDSNTYRFDGATKIGTVIPPKERKPAPKLSAKLLDGPGMRTLSKVRGHATVVSFWASWCGPCRTEMPLLSQLHTELKGAVDFVGVDSRDDTAAAKAFLTNNAISFPSVVDSGGALPQKLGNVPAGLPFTLVLDAKGRVAAIYVVRYTPKDLSAALTTLRRET